MITTIKILMYMVANEGTSNLLLLGCTPMNCNAESSYLTKGLSFFTDTPFSLDEAVQFG